MSINTEHRGSEFQVSSNGLYQVLLSELYHHSL